MVFSLFARQETEGKVKRSSIPAQTEDQRGWSLEVPPTITESGESSSQTRGGSFSIMGATRM